MMQNPPLPKRPVLTTFISVGSFADHVQAIATLARERRSSYVCCVNAHMTVECRDPQFAQVVDGADLATADGMPVLKALQHFHKLPQERVAGNDLLPALLARCEADGLRVYLYGGRADVLERIIERAGREYPRLQFAGWHAPPFAPLEKMDLQAEAARIEATGAQLVMVSLGCPKQERWMAAMKGRVNAVMLGLGGAFLLYAGVDTRAPKWMRDLSLEWLYRLCLEPRRLFRRYLVTNTLFVALFSKALWSGTHRRKVDPGHR
jgi:N-acetylglucosaminyldiphosphoundecaprenol N-acetyl-beta-D-mannosaminyltransferase